MLRLLKPGGGRQVFDLGAGHGVTSYALAKHGWKVTALEPDPSEEVGYGAIEAWRRQTGLPVEIVKDPQPPFPVPDSSMDAVIARQVLHHVPDLGACLRELWRILKPGGVILTTRDHVADDEQQLRDFLARHPLQRLYGGENAYPLAAYLSGFCQAGFELLEVWGPAESILNFFPGTEAGRHRMIVEEIRKGTGHPLVKWVDSLPIFRRRMAQKAAWRDRKAGRIYSIFARKPRRLDRASQEAAALGRWLPPGHAARAR